MEHLRVLIVDDQQLFAEGLKHVIEGESNECITVLGIAENGLEAVKMTQTLNPDVILMDIRMPKMNGVQATDIIHKKHPEIKVMILTTFNDDDLVFDALNCGANGYILKNIDPTELILAIYAVQTGAIYISESVGYRLIEKHSPRREKHDQNPIVTDTLAKIPSLTIREAEIIEQVINAQRNPEIAFTLNISEKTVRNHISNIYEKLNIHNRLELMKFIVGLGIGFQDMKPLT